MLLEVLPHSSSSSFLSPIISNVRHNEYHQYYDPLEDTAYDDLEDPCPYSLQEEELEKDFPLRLSQSATGDRSDDEMANGHINEEGEVESTHSVCN